MLHILQLTSATTWAPVRRSLLTALPIFVFIRSVGGKGGGRGLPLFFADEGVETWCNGEEGGGATRYARPWRPVKPLLTIWDVKANSVEHLRHFRVFGAAFRNLVSISASSLSGMPWRAWWRFECAVRGEAEVGDEDGVEKEERGEEVREGTDASEVLELDVVEDFRRVKGKEKAGRR